jgi:tetratricopeptide (TPR) repeat protein
MYWRSKGLTLASMRRSEEAIECYDKALEIAPDYQDAWNDKGNAFYDMWKLEEAHKCYDKALAVNPKYIWAWRNKAALYFAVAQFHDALISYDKALEVDPDDATTLHNKWQTLVKLRKNKEAQVQRKKTLESLESLIQKGPDYSPSWVLRGGIFRELSDYEEAERSFIRAIELDRKNAEGYDGLTVLYSECLYKHDQALQMARRAFEIKPDVEGYAANLAECLIKAGNFAGGRTRASLLLKETGNPTYRCVMEFLIFSSRVLEGDGDTAEKNGEFSKFIDDYQSLDGGGRAGLARWEFKGLTHAIAHFSAPLQIKFLLAALIDMLKGNAAVDRMAFFEFRPNKR